MQRLARVERQLGVWAQVLEQAGRQGTIITLAAESLFDPWQLWGINSKGLLFGSISRFLLPKGPHSAHIRWLYRFLSSHGDQKSVDSAQHGAPRAGRRCWPNLCDNLAVHFGCTRVHLLPVPDQAISNMAGVQEHCPRRRSSFLVRPIHILCFISCSEN